jgi:hypothetical protein
MMNALKIMIFCFLFCSTSSKRKKYTPKRLVYKPFMLDETWSGYETFIALRQEKIFIIKSNDSKKDVVNEMVNSLKENCRVLNEKDLKVKVFNSTGLNFTSSERQHEDDEMEQQTHLKADEPSTS